MITANVINRTFFIRSTDYGTAFTIDVDGKQYFVTARHVYNGSDSIKMFYQNKWLELNAKNVGVCGGDIDISVFSVEFLATPKELTLPSGSAGIVLGQEVRFLGFPYKLWSDGGDALKGRPMPYVKGGLLSNIDSGREGCKLWVDAVNNEGFSGGPLLFQKNRNHLEWKVAGVVSKFYIQQEKVVDQDGDDTNLRIYYNTGLMVCYDINHAIDIIKKNPIGCNLE